MSPSEENKTVLSLFRSLGRGNLYFVLLPPMGENPEVNY